MYHILYKEMLLFSILRNQLDYSQFFIRGSFKNKTTKKKKKTVQPWLKLRDDVAPNSI